MLLARMGVRGLDPHHESVRVRQRGIFVFVGATGLSHDGSTAND